MTLDQIARARWVQNSPSTMILKCRARDGGAVLATITKTHFFLWWWELQDKSESGSVRSGYTAQRRIRSALRAQVKEVLS